MIQVTPHRFQLGGISLFLDNPTAKKETTLGHYTGIVRIRDHYVYYDGNKADKIIPIQNWNEFLPKLSDSRFTGYNRTVISGLYYYLVKK